MKFAKTPVPPYYAVIFTSKRTDGDYGYKAMSEKIEELVKLQPGFIGMESSRTDIGITVCYWNSMESIRQWAENELHKEAKQQGKKQWYKDYKVRISKVEIEY